MNDVGKIELIDTYNRIKQNKLLEKVINNIKQSNEIIDKLVWELKLKRQREEQEKDGIYIMEV